MPALPRTSAGLAALTASAARVVAVHRAARRDIKVSRTRAVIVGMWLDSDQQVLHAKLKPL